MTVEQGLVTAPAPDVGDSREPYSVAWWERRTAEDLRDIINRGFAGGQLFRDAVAEAERRANQETKRLRAVAAAEAFRRSKRRKIFWGTAASLLIVTLLGFWIAS